MSTLHKTCEMINYNKLRLCEITLVRTTFIPLVTTAIALKKAKEFALFPSGLPFILVLLHKSTTQLLCDELQLTELVGIPLIFGIIKLVKIIFSRLPEEEKGQETQIRYAVFFLEKVWINELFRLAIWDPFCSCKSILSMKSEWWLFI